MAEMKSYVVNEGGGNPRDSSQWSERALVIASSPKEAVKLADRGQSPQVAEVDMSKAEVIAALNSPY